MELKFTKVADVKCLNLRVGGVPEHFNLPWHLACEGQMFQGLDANVSFREFGGGTGQLADALDGDRLDMAILLLEGAVKKILSGGAYRIVKLYTESPLIWGIHVAAESPIQTVQDCRNKRIAISRRGSGSHLIAIVDAAERGWSTDNMKFVEVDDLAGARQALAGGEADVFLWEKFMTKPLVDDGEFRRVGDRVVPWPAFVIAVRESILRSHPDLVLHLLQQLMQVCKQLKQDPAAAQVLATRYNLQPEDARQWLDRTTWSQGFQMPGEAIQRVVNYLHVLHLLDQDHVDIQQIWHALAE